MVLDKSIQLPRRRATSALIYWFWHSLSKEAALSISIGDIAESIQFQRASAASTALDIRLIVQHLRSASEQSASAFRARR